jgi:ribulose-bisphosphate carboxylase small chain
MRLTQGTFSFLPDLTEDEIRHQVEYCLRNGWPINIEYTDDPHPRNTYWELFALPMFDQRDPAAILAALDECRRTFPNHYIKLNAYDRSRGRETVALSFLVHRPEREPGFRLIRSEGPGRTVRYTVASYATERPEGERYG